MSKKIKRNTSNIKNGGKNFKGKDVFKKNKQEGQNKSKYNSSVVKDQNLKFKRKFKKNNHTLQKKLKQVHKNGGNHSSANLIDSDIVKVVNINKVQSKKTLFQANNKRKQEKLNVGKQWKQRKHVDQIPNQPKKEIVITQKSIKKKNSPLLSNANEVKNSKHAKHKKKKKEQTQNETAKLNTVLQKKMMLPSAFSQKESNNSETVTKNHNLDIIRLEEMLAAKQKQMKKEKTNTNAKPLSLRERMMTKLKASRFRYLNETLYNSESSESKKYFKDDPDAFKAYHEGYKQQVVQWPLNPVDVIISSIKKMPKEYIIADFGCGEGKLAVSVTQKVHSFDFVSLNENVTVCDVAHTPLLTNGVHVVVFCLSLMGTNLKDYIIEANRVLKKDGILKIAEVESRFEQVEDFIKILGDYGFKNTWKDLSHNLFYFLDFKKETDIGSKRNKLPPITLKPCLYKKR